MLIGILLVWFDKLEKKRLNKPKEFQGTTDLYLCTLSFPRAKMFMPTGSKTLSDFTYRVFLRETMISVHMHTLHVLLKLVQRNGQSS